MDRGAWLASLHGVAKKSDPTGQLKLPPPLPLHTAGKRDAFQVNRQSWTLAGQLKLEELLPVPSSLSA